MRAINASRALWAAVLVCLSVGYTGLRQLKRTAASSLCSKSQPLPALSVSRKAYLDDRTLWRITFKLQKKNFKDVEAMIRVRFVPDRGYEPPSGRLFIEDDYNGLVRCDEAGYSSFRWSLSEDKNDRKDGLWVWGLFEEPKYPYLYLSLAVYEDVILASGESEPIFGGEGVPNNRLNLRFNHAPDKDKGTLLSSGELTYQLTELVKADPLGIGGSVNVGDVLSAGSVDIQPVFETSA